MGEKRGKVDSSASKGCVQQHRICHWNAPLLHSQIPALSEEGRQEKPKWSLERLHLQNQAGQSPTMELSHSSVRPGQPHCPIPALQEPQAMPSPLQGDPEWVLLLSLCGDVHGMKFPSVRGAGLVEPAGGWMEIWDPPGAAGRERETSTCAWKQAGALGCVGELLAHTWGHEGLSCVGPPVKRQRRELSHEPQIPCQQQKPQEEEEEEELGLRSSAKLPW